MNDKQILKFSREYAKKAGFALNKDKKQLAYVIKGLKKNPDYIIEKENETIIIEIGGISKSKTQLKGFELPTLIIDERQLMLLGLF